MDHFTAGSRDTVLNLAVPLWSVIIHCKKVNGKAGVYPGCSWEQFGIAPTPILSVDGEGAGSPARRVDEGGTGVRVCRATVPLTPENAEIPLGSRASCPPCGVALGNHPRSARRWSGRTAVRPDDVPSYCAEPLWGSLSLPQNEMHPLPVAVCTPDIFILHSLRVLTAAGDPEAGP
jgi:hypothetical protein